MTDHFARPYRAASSERIAALHRLCDEDYAKGQQQRAERPFNPHEFAPPAISHPAPEPTDLDVAVHVAQQLLDSDNPVALREALRLLLRGVGAEPIDQAEAARRSVDRAFPVVAAFLAAERGEDQ
ncbi:hypothetical protein [Streptomyces scabiei]|uniref:hypothetical protein n=1 Tax=Streptomyces scabiei TaxID=1930 RepID=UPI0004E7AAE3|nr:hypothetical protein [Streptomyces scabiei]KFG07490.1 hypothetical protein IQ61_18980 [Streptomyces scabiei]MDX3679483.1 hypothetical protein [Streptomyces scabiei]